MLFGIDGSGRFWLSKLDATPLAGVDLQLQESIGGTATFTFQAEIDHCDDGDVIVNRVNISAADAAETAIAVTQCVDDSDGDSD